MILTTKLEAMLFRLELWSKLRPRLQASRMYMMEQSIWFGLYFVNKLLFHLLCQLESGLTIGQDIGLIAGSTIGLRQAIRSLMKQSSSQPVDLPASCFSLERGHSEVLPVWRTFSLK